MYETNVIWHSDPFKINKMNVRYTIQVCIPLSVSVSLADLILYYTFYKGTMPVPVAARSKA